VSPLCRHFRTCGGCTLQDVPEADYRAGKRDAVVRALTKFGVSAEVSDVVAVPPATRRRATLKIGRTREGVEVGFHPLRSHAIVDLRECLVMTPGLVALVQALRIAAHELFANGQPAEAHVVEADNGMDIGFRAEGRLNTALTAALAKAAPALNAARITWNGALAFERAAPVVRVGSAEVKLPIDSFLQPTRAGEEALRVRVLAAVKGAKNIADLFCGVGTFALALAEQGRVHAVEREQVMLDALAAAAKATQGLKPITTARRDLFKVPVTALEFAKFEAVVLDPPRAGAEAQARQLARSKVPRLAYVSCDAQSFARDARILIDGGYRIGAVTPVDQFLWSSHIELVAAFARP
jgi:23S rRNA (uracil1939-C5)-methyltransferase